MITTYGITYNKKWYGWSVVYKISGLCKEDFTHDSTGSWEHFVECLEKWEDGNET